MSLISSKEGIVPISVDEIVEDNPLALDYDDPLVQEAMMQLVPWPAPDYMHGSLSIAATVGMSEADDSDESYDEEDAESSTPDLPALVPYGTRIC